MQTDLNFPESSRHQLAVFINAYEPTEDKLGERYNDILCPITQEVMKEPKFIADCHSYSNVIRMHLERSNRSPLTGGILSNSDVHNNFTLKKLIRSLIENQQIFYNKLTEISLKIEIERLKELISYLSPAISEDQNILLKNIEDTPTDPNLYISLANSLSTEGEQAHRIQRELYLRAHSFDPTNIEALRRLASSLSRDDSIFLFDKQKKEQRLYSKQELYLLLIQLDPKDASHYYNLATTLYEGEVIHLQENGPPFTELDLCLLAIDLNPSYPYPYNNLGTLIPKGRPIRLKNGQQMDQNALFLKAYYLDQTYAIPIHNLANALEPNEKIILPPDFPIKKGIKLPEDFKIPRHMLDMLAIHINPQYARPYYTLASVLGNKAKIVLFNGCIMSKKDLLKKAIKLDKAYGRPYHALALILDENENIMLFGKVYSKQGLILMAIQLDPKNPNFYASLYKVLKKDEIALLDGRILSKEQIFQLSNTTIYQ